MQKQDLSAALSNFTSTTNAKIEKLKKSNFDSATQPIAAPSKGYDAAPFAIGRAGRDWE